MNVLAPTREELETLARHKVRLSINDKGALCWTFAPKTPRLVKQRLDNKITRHRGRLKAWMERMEQHRREEWEEEAA